MSESIDELQNGLDIRDIIEDGS